MVTRSLRVLPRALPRLALAALLLALLPMAADASARPVMRTASTPVGIVVAGPTGHSVYRFDLDHQGTRRSACTGACLRVWHPVTYAGTARTRIRLVGVTARVGSIPAAHHRRQVTLGGWPVYYYAGDTAAGQVNGHGSGGVWWPVAPDGSRIKVIPVDPPIHHGAPPAASYSLTTRIGTPVTAGLRTRSTPLGVVVTGPGGRTAYVFDLDHAGTRHSACTGACRRVWPPLTFRGTARTKVSVRGIAATVSSIPVSPGVRQVTIGGQPLYYYAGDAAPGQVNGEGSGGTWWVVSPAGARIR